MVKVRNTSPGVRIVNVFVGTEKDAEGNRRVSQVALNPGQEEDLDLVEDDAVKGYEASGEITHGDAEPKTQTDEERYKSDPFQRDRVAAQTQAGSIPGFAEPTADKLPEEGGESTEGGEGSVPKTPRGRGR